MDYQLTQTGPEVQGILNQAPEVVAVGNLNTIDAVGNYYVTDGDGKARGYLICSQSGPEGSPFYLQTYLHDGAIYSRSGNALPLTGEWVNPMQDVANIKKVSTEELNGLINSSDNGLYYATLGGTTPALVQVYRDGAKAYQWFIEPHTGKIFVREYNTQATTPAWSDLVDAYADKQDTIDDLSTIRSGAAAGATAVQPAALQEGLATKQNVIDDLSTIRSGAAKGATAVQPAVLTPIQTALQTIEDVIPSSASSQNQLADKNFVNSSISTNTANFVGTFNSLSELQAVQNPTNNDYGFVIEQDAAGNEYYDRYKFNGSQWLFEYKVESTPFTAAQWAAIQSGMTAALVTKLDALPTSQQLSTQLAGKQDTISDLSTIRSGAAAGATAYQKPNAGIPKTDLASAVQESLGKADAAAPQSNTYTKEEVDAIIENIDTPITEIQRSALDNTTTPGVYKVVGTTGSSAANSSWISLLLVSDYDFSMIGGSTNHIVTQRLFNGRGASDSVKIEERTKTNNGLWSEWVDIYGSDIDEIWEELDAKQDTIDDLSTIRSGAAAGATAVQPAALQEGLAGKQNTISDLSTIRSGAAAGATAVQPAAMNTALAAKQDTISTVNVTVDNNTGTPSGSASVSGGTLSLSFQNLKGAAGAQGPQGIQGVQGPQGPKGDTGVTGDASSLAIIHGIDKTTTYGTNDVCGADAAQALLNEIEGGFYY